MLKKKILLGIFLLCLMQLHSNGYANPGSIQSSVFEGVKSPKHLIVVAHQDDDILFMNPDLWNDIQAGHEIETVYTTAGDRHQPDRYWLAREAGAKAAYAYMAKVADDWVEEKLELDGHPIVRFILRQNPKIRLVFLRLPDGIDIRRWEITLKTIWQYDQVIIYSKDRRNMYRKGDLVRVLRDLMEEFQPEAIEYVYPGDHVDHYHTAKFAGLAERAYHKKHVVIRYRDYNIYKSPPNLNAFDSHLKWKIAQVYGKHDKFFPKWGLERTFYRYYNWCHRQYYYIDRFMGNFGEKNPLDSLLAR